MEQKINDTVWTIEITKYVDPKEYSYRSNGVKISEYKIIGISCYRICINSPFFQTFDFVEKGKRKTPHNSYLNDVNVSIRTNGNILGDGIFCTLHSTKKPSKKTLNKMVANIAVEIDKNYGWLFGGVKDELYNMVESFDLKADKK